MLLEKETEVLDEFYVDFESSIPSWDIEVVRDFFDNHNSNGLEAQCQSRAKLDGRCRDTEFGRWYPNWLTPAELEYHLGVKVSTWPITEKCEALTSAAVQRDKQSLSRCRPPAGVSQEESPPVQSEREDHSEKENNNNIPGTYTDYVPDISSLSSAQRIAIS